jgi:glyoxylase-like metal-dependent hydrolase (beta-lactamase superfamily II)
MARYDVILQGSSFRTNLASLGLSTIALVRGDGNILLDTGHFGNRRQLLNALEKLGITPADIDTVILTHSHWDHALNLEVFGRAEVVINSKELNHVNSIKGYDWATPSFLGGVLEKRRVKVVEGDVPLSRDVFLVETPGHSPGHQSVLVETDEGRVLFSGDAMPTMRSYIRELPDYIVVSDDVARSSIRKMKNLKPDVFYPGHDRPFRVVDGNPEYLTQTELKVIFRGETENFGILLSTENAEKPEKM